MADVNLLFQAPMKPQSVLLFRLIFKMGGLIAAGLYLIFQIPNLHMNMGVPMGACIAMLAVWGLTLVTGQLLSVLVYTITATHVRLRKYIVPAVVGICGAAALAFAAYWQSSGGDLLSSAFAFWCSKGALLIPIWGWIKAVLADRELSGSHRNGRALSCCDWNSHCCYMAHPCRLLRGRNGEIGRNCRGFGTG